MLHRRKGKAWIWVLVTLIVLAVSGYAVQRSVTVRASWRVFPYQTLRLNDSRSDITAVAFDFPDPTMPTGNRGSTVVAPQALLLMNSEMIMDSATSLARRLLKVSVSDHSRIEMAFEQILGRRPDQMELERASQLVEDSSSTSSSDSALAWAMLCQGLMITNEFIYLQ